MAKYYYWEEYLSWDEFFQRLLDKIARGELNEIYDWPDYYKFDLLLVTWDKFSIRDAACISMLNEFTECSINAVEVDLCQKVIEYYAAAHDGDFESCAWELWREVENQKYCNRSTNYVEIPRYAWFDEEETNEIVEEAIAEYNRR